METRPITAWSLSAAMGKPYRGAKHLDLREELLDFGSA